MTRTHFYGGVKGNHKGVSRFGTPSSGLCAFACGRNIGARIECAHNSEGEDIIIVSLDRGSTGGPIGWSFAIKRDRDDGFLLIRADENIRSLIDDGR